MNSKIDNVDLKIISHLQEDCRISLSDLSTKINLAVSSTSERIKRLQQAGVIKEFSSIVDAKKLGFEICAFIQIFINPKKEQDFIDEITQIPEIQECHFITGEYSYLLKVRVKSTAALEELLSHKINNLPGVGKTNSMIALSSFKESQKLYFNT